MRLYEAKRGAIGKRGSSSEMTVLLLARHKKNRRVLCPAIAKKM
jgi:hypothetical protein